jgi:hypothetical protein
MAFLDVVPAVPAEFEALGPAAARVLATEGRICFPIRSSAISELCYTVEQTLTITFADGSLYEIPNFPVLEARRRRRSLLTIDHPAPFLGLALANLARPTARFSQK